MPAPERPTESDLLDVVDRGLSLLEPEIRQAPIEATDLRTRYLGADAVLVTYRSRQPSREALRSSVWLRDTDAGWLLLFHQGTPSAAA